MHYHRMQPHNPSINDDNCKWYVIQISLSLFLAASTLSAIVCFYFTISMYQNNGIYTDEIKSLSCQPETRLATEALTNNVFIGLTMIWTYIEYIRWKINTKKEQFLLALNHLGEDKSFKNFHLPLFFELVQVVLIIMNTVEAANNSHNAPEPQEIGYKEYECRHSLFSTLLILNMFSLINPIGIFIARQTSSFFSSNPSRAIHAEDHPAAELPLAAASHI